MQIIVTQQEIFDFYRAIQAKEAQFERQIKNFLIEREQKAKKRDEAITLIHEVQNAINGNDNIDSEAKGVLNKMINEWHDRQLPF